MMKSSQHHASVKYRLRPYATNLSSISKTKMIEKILSHACSMCLRIGLCSMCTSSRAWASGTKAQLSVLTNEGKGAEFVGGANLQ